MRATSSSAVSLPPVLFEIVPPVATSRTRGASAAGACVAGGWAEAGACARTDRSASANVKTMTANDSSGARMAPLYLRGLPGVIQSKPATQVLDGFVWRMPIKRHHRSRSARGARDLCAPAIAADRGYL